MSLKSDGVDLAAPLAGESPCGESLDDKPEIVALDAFQLFGRSAAFPVPDKKGGKNDPKAPPWQEIKSQAVAALARTKDLRVLSHLSAAGLRTDGFPVFFETLSAASTWLERYWNHVFPLLGNDGVMRRNALNDFGDPHAILDGLRRAPLVSSRQHGQFSLRDIGVSAGRVQPRPDEQPVPAKQIEAAFLSAPLGELTTLLGEVEAGAAAAKAIEAAMVEKLGTDGAPDFEGLTTQLDLIAEELRVQIVARPDGASAGVAAGGQKGQTPMVPAGGPIQTREDALRAMSAVAEYFARTEPSSPIPMLVERASRLVAKGFLDVLKDLAPEAVPAVRRAGGLKDE